MLSWKTLLVPTDFSEGADEALAYAKEIALERKARLILLHATELPAVINPAVMILPAGPATPEVLEQYIRETSAAWLEARAKPLREAGIVCECLVELGSPAHLIVEVAAQKQADLILMSTHGRTGFSRFVVGSVAELVVRMAPVPVLTFHRKATPDKK